MRNKSWTKNMPPQGVLCKKDSSDHLYKVSKVDDKDMCFHANVFIGLAKDLTPVMPQELWQFMPWQPMESAPTDGMSVLLMDDIGFVDTAYFYNNKWLRNCEKEFLDPVGYLPLPLQNKS